MISLKKYLDDGNCHPAADRMTDPFQSLLSAYLASVKQIGECGREVSADLAIDLVRGIARASDSLKAHPTIDGIVSSELAVREALRSWGNRVIEHQEQCAKDVKDLLLVTSRTAESLGCRDDRFVRHMEDLSSKLASIATLDDLGRIRSSVEASARELKRSVATMAAETRALIEHLRLELDTYQTKLEKAEQIASRDAVTGLGSRHWIESYLQERIQSGARLSIVLIDIEGFGDVIETYGNLVSEILLKEFARELRCACRFTDILGRWGQGEFIIASESSRPEMEPQVSRLCAWVSKVYHVPCKSSYVKVLLTASASVAEYRAGEDLLTFVERADSELCRQRGYEARQKSA